MAPKSDADSARPGVTVTNWALGIAVGWSAALVASAFVVPFYSSQDTRSTADGATVTSNSTATLVGENGLGVLAPVSLPLVLALACTWALLRYRDNPTRGLGRLAWVLAASTALFTVLSLMTIGIFILPVAIALVVACAKGAPMAPPKGSPFNR